jgi:hypothetical protein
MLNGTRREILRLLGYAPAAASPALRQIAGIVNSPAAVAALTLTSGIDAQPPPSPGGNTRGNGLSALHRMLDSLLDAANGQEYDANLLRAGKLDPDIEVLRSVSPVNKSRLQRERLAEQRAIFVAARELMRGNPFGAGRSGRKSAMTVEATRYRNRMTADMAIGLDAALEAGGKLARRLMGATPIFTRLGADPLPDGRFQIMVEPRIVEALLKRCELICMQRDGRGQPILVKVNSRYEPSCRRRA